MSTAATVSTSDFEQEVLASSLPVLVDFFASWCMPCKMLSPTIDELAEDYAGRVKVVKLDIDNNQPLAAQYGIRGVPTLIVFNGGEPVDRIVGVQTKNAIAEKLDKVLSAQS